MLCKLSIIDSNVESTIEPSFDELKFRRFQLSRSTLCSYIFCVGTITLFIFYSFICFAQQNQSSTTISLYIVGIFTLFCGWSVCFLTFQIRKLTSNDKEKKNVGKLFEKVKKLEWFDLNFFEQNDDDTLIKFMAILEEFFIVSATSFSGLVLTYKSQHGTCGNIPSMYQLCICNSEYKAEHISTDLAIMTLLVSLTTKIMLKGSRHQASLISLALAIFFVLYSIYITHFWKSLWILFLMVPLSVASLGELRRQNVESFTLTESLKQTLEDNEKMAEELRLNEMKIMIGNVAHDLKTPLTAFITTLDGINDLENKLRLKLKRLFSLFKSSMSPSSAKLLIKDLDTENMTNELKNIIYSLLSNIRGNIDTAKNINSFMLMSINRYIDFTKVRHGVTLKPKMETICLSEVMDIPLACVRDMQTAIEVEMLPISTNICTHVITDRQWFQENVLCLLSNAVKFSNKGKVTIKIFLWRPPSIDSVVTDTDTCDSESDNGEDKFEFLNDEIDFSDDKVKDCSRLSNTTFSEMLPLPLSRTVSENQVSKSSVMRNNSNRKLIRSISKSAESSTKPGPLIRHVSDDTFPASSLSTHVSFAVKDPLAETYRTSHSFKSKRRLSFKSDPGSESRLASLSPVSQFEDGESNNSLIDVLFNSSKNYFPTPKNSDKADTSHCDNSVSPKYVSASMKKRSNMNDMSPLPGDCNSSSNKSCKSHYTPSVKHSSNKIIDYIRIEIEDEGIGIAPDELDQLFAPFKQAQRMEGGTGLGLFSLAKRSESLNGFYGAEPRADGQQGTMFWFSFPYQPDQIVAKTEKKEMLRRLLARTPPNQNINTRLGSKHLEHIDTKLTANSDSSKFFLNVPTDSMFIPSLKLKIANNESNKLNLDIKKNVSLPLSSSVKNLSPSNNTENIIIQKCPTEKDSIKEVLSNLCAHTDAGKSVPFLVQETTSLSTVDHCREILNNVNEIPINKPVLDQLNLPIKLGESSRDMTDGGFKTARDIHFGGIASRRQSKVYPKHDDENHDDNSSDEISEEAVQPMHILVVDDSLAIRKVLMNMLTNQGHTLVSAHHGAEAVDRWNEQIEKNNGVPFDIILMDMQMPVMDGLEATRRIRATEKVRLKVKCLNESNIKSNTINNTNGSSKTIDYPSQYILAFSANSDDDTIAKAYEAGCNDFMPKPFTNKILYAKLRTIQSKLHFNKGSSKSKLANDQNKII